MSSSPSRGTTWASVTYLLPSCQTCWDLVASHYLPFDKMYYSWKEWKCLLGCDPELLSTWSLYIGFNQRLWFVLKMFGNPAEKPPTVGVCSLLVQVTPTMSLHSPSQIEIEGLHLWHWMLLLSVYCNSLLVYNRVRRTHGIFVLMSCLHCCTS